MAETESRVLVVEDDEFIRKACVRAIRAAGHETVPAEDGVLAKKLLAEQSFHAVVSDIAMPGMDGIELLRVVRNHDLDLPVILMTGTPSIATAAQAVEHGALRYLVKPVDLNELMPLLDKAVRLYRLAQARRRVLELMNPDKLSSDRVGLDVKLESAMARLWMAYQPIVSWPAKNLFAYEALMRSAEPALPHPGAILQAAERLDRVHDLGRKVRNSVAELLSKSTDVILFVNLHTLDLLDRELYAEASPLSSFSSRVVLELTERAALDRVDDVAGSTKKLRKLGFRLAIDDLGAGYAGLSSFAQLDPDIVKLDMSLIRNIDRDPTRRVLVESLIGACRNLKVPVVAEGIETTGERDILGNAGADLLQGFLFGRPDRELLRPSV